MIYVSEDQLKEVEYIIQQSMQGNHVLFDMESVRQIFGSDNPPCDFSCADAYEVEPHIERLLVLPTLAQKRAYLDGLDRRTYTRVVKTYFNIVENSMYESLEVKH